MNKGGTWKYRCGSRLTHQAHLMISQVCTILFVWGIMRVPKEVPKDDCMDYYKECVDAVDALMLQMLSTLKDAEVPVKTFLVKHKDTNTVVKIPALNESHAFWKWATESSAGLFNPWDLVDECLALGRWWTYNLDMDHLYHWTRAVHNGNLGYPSPKDLMEDLTRKFTNVVSIEAEAESITE